MGTADFEEKLQCALRLELPYSERLRVNRQELPGTDAAVLILLALGGAEPAVLLTKRTETVDTHKGQYAFPGGRAEEEDATRILTALRETQEEVGIPFSKVRVLGNLPEIWTPTRYWVYPVVGVMDDAFHQIELIIDPKETAEAFWVPLSKLLEPGVYVPIHTFVVEERRIWGATGAMLKNLLDRLAIVG